MCFENCIVEKYMQRGIKRGLQLYTDKEGEATECSWKMTVRVEKAKGPEWRLSRRLKGRKSAFSEACPCGVLALRSSTARRSAHAIRPAGSSLEPENRSLLRLRCTPARTTTQNNSSVSEFSSDLSFALYMRIAHLMISQFNMLHSTHFFLLFTPSTFHVFFFLNFHFVFIFFLTINLLNYKFDFVVVEFFFFYFSHCKQKISTLWFWHQIFYWICFFLFELV